MNKSLDATDLAARIRNGVAPTAQTRRLGRSRKGGERVLQMVAELVKSHGWRFGALGDRCALGRRDVMLRGVFDPMFDPKLNEPMTPEEVEAVLRHFREGHEWRDGGCGDYSLWSFRDGTFVENGFDQGRHWTTVLSEAKMREQIVAAPRSFREFLRAKT